MSPKLSLAILLPCTLTALAIVTFAQWPAGAGQPKETVEKEVPVEEPEPEKIAEPIPVTWLQLDEATSEIFESWPPAASDYAVFFRHLKDNKPTAVAVLPTLYWSGLDPILEQILAKQIGELPTVLGGILDAESVVPVTTEAVSRLPQISNIKGDRSNIPAFTGFGAMPNDGLWQSLPLGFTQIEFGIPLQLSEEWIELPLLARFEDQIVPALPLVTLMSSLGTTVDAIEVVLGDAIVLGDRRIPIDEKGRCRILRSTLAEIPTRSAQSILPAPLQNSLHPLQPETPAPLEGILILGEHHPSAPQFTFADGTVLSRDHVLAAGIAALAQNQFWEPPAEAPTLAQIEIVSEKRTSRFRLAVETYGLRIAYWFACFALGGMILLQTPHRARQAAFVAFGLSLLAVVPPYLEPIVPFTCLIAGCLSLMREVKS